jgi:hypothetical protein
MCSNPKLRACAKRPAEIAHVVEELVADLLSNGMPLSHRKCRCHRNTHFCPEVMAHPAGLHLCYRLHI